VGRPSLTLTLEPIARSSSMPTAVPRAVITVGASRIADIPTHSRSRSDQSGGSDLSAASPSTHGRTTSTHGRTASTPRIIGDDGNSESGLPASRQRSESGSGEPRIRVFHGHVLLGHATSLSLQRPSVRARILGTPEALAAGAVGLSSRFLQPLTVVANPNTNMSLQDRLGTGE
jgi:hypothetical protein